MSRSVLWVAAGGAIGAALRYLVGGWVQTARWVEEQVGGGALFPWGTLVVNLSGCLAIGLLAGLFQERLLVSPGLRVFVLMGILGGYTTFSSFGLETHRLLVEGSWLLAAGNAFGSVLGGLAGVWLGDLAARAI